MNLPKHLKYILWDVDPSTLDAKHHQRFIITRVAEKGTLADVRWLQKTFGTPAIKKAVSASRNTSAKTKNFWHIL